MSRDIATTFDNDVTAEEAIEHYRALGLFQTIETLNCSARINNSLNKHCFTSRRSPDEYITYIGQLIQKTDKQLLRVPSFGRKSLAEIQEKLQEMNLELGTKLPHWPSLDDLEDIAKGIIKKKKTKQDILHEYKASGLFQTIESLNFSVRTGNCLKDAGITHIGDLIQKEGRYLLKLPNFGRYCLDEIERKLNPLDLRINTVLPCWPTENIEDIAAECLREQVKNLEKTLRQSFDEWLENDPNKVRYTRILEDRFGLNEKPFLTLDGAADNIGVSKERLRQIEFKLDCIFRRRFFTLMDAKLETLLHERTAPLDIKTIGQEDHWFAGFEQNPSFLANIIKRTARRLYHVNKIFDQVVISKLPPDDLKLIQYAFKRNSDIGVESDFTEELKNAPELKALFALNADTAVTAKSYLADLRATIQSNKNKKQFGRPCISEAKIGHIMSFSQKFAQETGYAALKEIINKTIKLAVVCEKPIPQGLWPEISAVLWQELNETMSVLGAPTQLQNQNYARLVLYNGTGYLQTLKAPEHQWQLSVVSVLKNCLMRHYHDPEKLITNASKNLKQLYANPEFQDIAMKSPKLLLNISLFYRRDPEKALRKLMQAKNPAP